MKKIICGLCICFFSFFYLSMNVFSEEKIGFVNLQEVILHSDIGKENMSKFKIIMEKNRSILIEKEIELKRLKENLEKHKFTLREDTLRKKETEFDKKFKEYQTTANRFNENLRQKEEEIFRKLIPDIVKIIKSIAENEKYTMIIDPSITQLPYHALNQDLTKKVIENFNNIFNFKK